MKYIDLGSCLQRAVGRWGSRVCATCGDDSLTFSRLYERSLKLADALRSSGLDKGDRVGVLLRNRLEYLELIFAATFAGLVIVPVNRRLGASDIEYIAHDAKLRLLVTEGLFEPITSRVKDLGVDILLVGKSPTTASSYEVVLQSGMSTFSPVPVDDDAMQSIHYTSGTTGNPKGAMHSHASTFAMISGMRGRFHVEPGEAWLLAVPAHSAGVYAVAIAPLLHGAHLFMTNDFDAEETLSLLQTEQVVGTLLVPTMWELLLNSPDADDVKLPALRYPLWGGMPLKSGTADRLDAWLEAPCLGSYGLTEAACICYATAETYKSGRRDSAGFPVETMEVRIADDDGSEVARGEDGEVLIRGSAMMMGYINQPDLTASAVRDGWFHTGDWGRVDEDGALAVVDRKKDMIISGGENIYPAELEDSLSTMPGILEAAIVGLPDDVWGQSVCAVIVASDESVTAEGVNDWCVRRHAKYKNPRRVVFMNALPKNAMGKVVKPEIIETIVTGRA